MTEVTLTEWNQFLTKFPDAHLLQMGEWGELKKDFGWKPVRVISENAGAQILFRRLPLGFTVGYMPKVSSEQLSHKGTRSATSEQFWREVDSVCKKNRAIFLKIEPDGWEEQSHDTWQVALRTSPHNIQPPRTITLDIKDITEEFINGDIDVDDREFIEYRKSKIK